MAKEAKQSAKVTAKLTNRAADGKISGKDVANLTQRYGAGMVANAIAPMGLANPSLAIGKNVGKYSGLKFFGEGDQRYAQFDQSRIRTNPFGVPMIKGQPMFTGRTSTTGAFDNTRFGDNWYSTANGGYRYGGPAGQALPTSTTTPTEIPYNPEYQPDPLVPEEDLTLPEFNSDLPTSTASTYSPGGIGSAVDGGATGFRRKKSSSRLAGLTTKGTSQFKIAGQNSKSSGLNIGV